MIYSFEWNGVNSRDMGIRLQSMPEIIRPEERIQHVTIPGRAGELTMAEGADIYNSYIQTIPVAVYTEAAVKAAEAWLRGSGYVTFSGQPGLRQRARVINAVTFTKHGRNSHYWDGQVQFYCEPLKEANPPEADIVLTASGTVNNPGDVTAFPKIVIAGTGDVTISAGGKSIALTGIQSGTIVDSETGWVMYNGAALTGVYTGNFPVLPAGESMVAITGSVTSITITPRWRYL